MGIYQLGLGNNIAMNPALTMTGEALESPDTLMSRLPDANWGALYTRGVIQHQQLHLLEASVEVKAGLDEAEVSFRMDSQALHPPYPGQLGPLVVRTVASAETGGDVRLEKFQPRAHSRLQVGPGALQEVAWGHPFRPLLSAAEEVARPIMPLDEHGITVVSWTSQPR